MPLWGTLKKREGRAAGLLLAREVRRAVRVRRAGLPGGLRDLRPPPAAYAGADAAADRGPLGGADAAADGRADQRSDAGASRPTRAGGYL